MSKLSAFESAITVVVADDDDALREMLSESLRAMGLCVDEVADGEELRRYLEQARAEARLPSLVVSDHRMPRSTGLEVLSWASKAVPEVPFILLSAFAAPQLHERALQVGARAVLDKPVDLRELRQFVVEVVRASEPAASSVVASSGPTSSESIASLSTSSEPSASEPASSEPASGEPGASDVGDMERIVAAAPDDE